MPRPRIVSETRLCARPFCRPRRRFADRGRWALAAGSSSLRATTSGWREKAFWFEWGLPPLCRYRGGTTCARIQSERLFAFRAANDDFGFGNSHNRSPADLAAERYLLAIDHREAPVWCNED